MINARLHTFFGSGHGIGRPGQADSECRAAQEVTQTQAAKLRGAGFVRHWLVNARPRRAPPGYAGMAG